jgi:hypothetical protein
MGWLDAIGDIVSKYSGAGGGTATAPENVHQDFENVAKTAPAQVTADALAHAFRADQTPSFPEMVATLFQGSNSDQRAGLLNQLIGSLGTSTLASVPGLNGLASESGQDPTVSPEQANEISAEQVRQAAAHAQRTNPSVIDQVSSFYAEHPGVVKSLGTAAVTLVLQQITRRTS